MAVLSLLAVELGNIKVPGAPWERLILDVFDFITNYGWRILFFTLCLKLLLCPLDIYQRYKGRKNQKITEQLKPQMEKLAKQYPDKQVLAQKQMELNKKAGFSYFSACLPAIITLVVMFSLLGSLNKVSGYMNFYDYTGMYVSYENACVEYEETYANDEAKIQELKDNGVIRYEDQTTWSYKQQYAQYQVAEYYEEHKTSFLWVKNIWSPDVPWKKEVVGWKDFNKNVGDYAKQEKSGLSKEEYDQLFNEAKYNEVMGLLLEENHNKANGYLILPALSILLSVGTQLLSRLTQKQTGQTNEAMGGNTMKIMMWIMPVMIGIFSLNYTVAFTLYLIVSYAFGLVLTGGSQLIFAILDKRAGKKAATTVQKYGRPDPNDNK